MPVLILVLLLTTPTQGGAAGLNRIDSRTLAIQEKVEALYEQGEYQRAFFIYRNELAPLGDKYAQYMVGFMYLTGTGVEEDPVLASAWYRLAAERSYPEFVAIRDQTLRDLSDIEIGRSDAEYLRLRGQFSDLAILLRLAREEYRNIGVTTGSRLGGGSSAVTIVDPQTGDAVSKARYNKLVRDRVESRLRAINKLLVDEQVETDADDVDLDEVAVIVERQLATISDR